MADPNELPFPLEPFSFNGDVSFQLENTPLIDDTSLLANGNTIADPPAVDDTTITTTTTTTTSTRKRRAATNASRRITSATFYDSDSDEDTTKDIKRHKPSLSIPGYTPGSSASGKAPPGKKPQSAEEAGSDLPSLITVAANSKNLGDIVAVIDQRLPPYKGNNIHAKLLRQAFTSLQLGHFTIRKVAVVSMAQMLWLLAGKKGDQAVREAASVIYVDDLPENLRQYGSSVYISNGYGGGDAVLMKYFPQATSSVLAATPSTAVTPAARGQVVVHHPKAALTRPALDISTFHPLLRKFAEVGRQMLGLRRGDSVTLQAVMTTELLSNQRLACKNKDGVVLHKGVVAKSGRSIRCHCDGCGGIKDVTAVEFVEHGKEEGGEDRLVDAIIFEDLNHSAGELLTLMASDEVAAADVHMDHCYACKSGGDLLCCDGCTAAWHLSCVDLTSVPKGLWLCRLCKAEGRKLLSNKPSAASAPSSGKGRGRGGGRAGRPRGSSSTPADSQPKQNKRSLGGYGPSVNRVHMLAPSAQRRGRPLRNLNRNKRLFEGVEGGLVNGQQVFYTCRGEKVLSGTVVIDPAGQSGILCSCCQKVVSCSQFESHAGHAQRRQPYEHIYTTDGENLKAVAARLPEPDANEEWEVEQDVHDDPDAPITGCVLCRDPEFQRGDFGPRTIMLCDQCEREFHVGCMANAEMQKLESLPEGDWFCSDECGRIHAVLRRHVTAGLMPAAAPPPPPPAGDNGVTANGDDSTAAVDEEAPSDEPSLHTEAQPYTWQVLNGKNGQAATGHAIRAASDILQESFDPIIDMASNTDLLPLMLYARQHKDWDYRGMYTLLLRYKGKPVVSAIVRVCGPGMAELPLIATKMTARRRGHARVLVNLFEELLKEAHVHTLVLPAAHETVQTWKSGFNFIDMPEDQVKMAKQQLRILVFPGTEVLWKVMDGVPPPQNHHVLKELPSPADLAAVRQVVYDLVTAVCVVEGEEETKKKATGGGGFLSNIILGKKNNSGGEKSGGSGVVKEEVMTTEQQQQQNDGENGVVKEIESNGSGATAVDNGNGGVAMENGGLM